MALSKIGPKRQTGRGIQLNELFVEDELQKHGVDLGTSGQGASQEFFNEYEKFERKVNFGEQQRLRYKVRASAWKTEKAQFGLHETVWP